MYSSVLHCCECCNIWLPAIWPWHFQFLSGIILFTATLRHRVCSNNENAIFDFIRRCLFLIDLLIHLLMDWYTLVSGASNKLDDWVSDWVRNFSVWAIAQQWRLRKKWNLVQYLGNEDERRIHAYGRESARYDTQQSKNNNSNIIECCSSTHQGAPCTGKQTCAYASDLVDGQSRYLWN